VRLIGSQQVESLSLLRRTTIVLRFVSSVYLVGSAVSRADSTSGSTSRHAVPVWVIVLIVAGCAAVLVVAAVLIVRGARSSTRRPNKELYIPLVPNAEA
jgi:hypothetical protein